jgi:membrane associated rhomboid family serine protease
MITILLIALISITSIIAFKNRDMYIKGWFSPYEIKRHNQWLRFVTHIFLHASWEHLIFNMLTFYFFGMLVEQGFVFYFGIWGNAIFMAEFFLAGIISSMPSYFRHKDNASYTAVGASGAVSAILFSAILLDPLNKIYLMFIPIGIPAYIFGGVYLIYCAYMSKRNVDHIAHDVHFWGSIIGFLLPLLLRPEFFNEFFESITK